MCKDLELLTMKNLKMNYLMSIRKNVLQIKFELFIIYFAKRFANNLTRFCNLFITYFFISFLLKNYNICT